MCGVTMAIWFVCGLMILAAFSISFSTSMTMGLVITALGLAVVLPPVVTFFMPLMAGWHAANRKLRDRLIADGVMTASDADGGMRPVEAVQVIPSTERVVPNTRECGFLEFRDGAVRFIGEHTCWNSHRFKVMPGRSTRCARCAIIWVCGMAPFRLVLEDQGKPKEFLISSREGRKLSRAQNNTDMLAELGMMEDSYEAAEHGEPHSACFDVGEPAPASTPTVDTAASDRAANDTAVSDTPEDAAQKDIAP